MADPNCETSDIDEEQSERTGWYVELVKLEANPGAETRELRPGPCLV